VGLSLWVGDRTFFIPVLNQSLVGIVVIFRVAHPVAFADTPKDTFLLTAHGFLLTAESSHLHPIVGGCFIRT
jgi:hypothetical protein